MDKRLARFQESPITRRTFLCKGGKLFGLSLFAALVPLKSFFNVEETLFWLKFRITQRFDAIFFSIMGNVTKRFDRYFD